MERGLWVASVVTGKINRRPVLRSEATDGSEVAMQQQCGVALKLKATAGTKLNQFHLPSPPPIEPPSPLPITLHQQEDDG